MAATYKNGVDVGSWINGFNIFLDSQNRPWVYWSYWNYNDSNAEFGMIDHSIYSNGTWISQGGIFPYALTEFTTSQETPGVWSEYSAGPQWGASMVSYSDGDVQWLTASDGIGSNYTAYLFNPTSFISSFNTGLQSIVYLNENTVAQTPSGNFLVTAGYMGSPSSSDYSGEQLLEINETCVIMHTIAGYEDYGGQLSYDRQINSLVIITTDALYSNSTSGLVFWLFNLTSHAMSNYTVIVPYAFELHANTGITDEWLENTQLSPMSDSFGQFLLTYRTQNSEGNNVLYALIFSQGTPNTLYVPTGDSATLQFYADARYQLTSFTDNGINVLSSRPSYVYSNSSYTISNVNTNHTITITSTSTDVNDASSSSTFGSGTNPNIADKNPASATPTPVGAAIIIWAVLTAQLISVTTALFASITVLRRF